MEICYDENIGDFPCLDANETTKMKRKVTLKIHHVIIILVMFIHNTVYSLLRLGNHTPELHEVMLIRILLDVIGYMTFSFYVM